MMNTQIFKRVFLPVVTVLLLAGCSGSNVEQVIDEALVADHRTPTYVERDQFRHPKETLLFFGLELEQ
jgi:predicted methyltransferase